MDERVEVFEAERPRLVGLAYRMLGSVSDAEDVVQEAWFRFERTDLSTIDRPAAWLTTVVGRLGVDRLRARRRERADYVGPWLPEPVLGLTEPAAGPEAQAELADSLTLGFLLLLERLSPAERLALLLADVFGEPFSEVARVLDRSEPAARQLASRARRKLRQGGDDPPRRLGPEAEATAAALVTAVAAGDIAGVTRLLAPDVVLLSDGGAAVHAARRPVVGPDRVARFMVNLARRFGPDDQISLEPVNGSPGLVVRDRHGRGVFVVAFEVVDAQVVGIHAVRNPDKLAALDLAPELR